MAAQTPATAEIEK